MQDQEECQQDGTSSDNLCDEPDLGEEEEDVAPEPEPEDECLNNCHEFEPPKHRFLLLEDQSTSNSGLYPGVALDAITLTKSNGDVYYASRIKDFNGREDTTRLRMGDEVPGLGTILGAPDDTCLEDASTFASLGGPDGFVIITFTTQRVDVVIEDGDTITIHVVGDGCPGDGPAARAYAVSVAFSLADAQAGVTEEIGHGSRNTVFDVSGL